MTDELRKAEQAAARKVRKMDPRDVTVALWLDAWRVLFPGTRSDETAQHMDYICRAFKARYGRRLVSAVTPLIAQDWANKDPRSVKDLRTAFNKAMIAGVVSYNVWKVVELPRRTKPLRPVPTPEQLEAALARCRERGGWHAGTWHDAILFTAYTGARLGGVVNLKREHVDLQARRAILREKGDKVRRVALLGRSVEALERALARPEVAHAYVFPNCQRHRIGRSVASRAWRAVRGDFAGPFHSLRHYAATWLAANEVDERDIAVQLGHVDALGRPYTHLVRSLYVHPDNDAALDRLERAMEGA